MNLISTTHFRRATTIASAVAWVRAATLAATLLGITAVPTRADCNPADRISAQYYPDLQTATAAALAANQPLWLPAGTYQVPHTLFIDYTPQARVGFTIISDGAIIDGRAMHQPVVQIECASDCFYFHLVGTLTVWADVSDAAFQIGKLDFSDPHNSAKIDHLIVNNSDPWGTAVRFNYVLNADVSVYAVGGYVGLWLRQVQFSKINGAMTGEGGFGILIDDGYTFANTIQAIDVESSPYCMAIWSPYANRNTFVSPYFNCPTPIVATAGNSNMLLNASYGAAQPPAPGSQTGILTLP